MPRYVILEHDWPAPHWDFLLEAGLVLRAWRLLAEPGRGCVVPAEANADHRRVYLNYEGPVSGNRGNVRQWDTGTFEWLVDLADRVSVRLTGANFAGDCLIARGADGTLTAAFA